MTLYIYEKDGKKRKAIKKQCLQCKQDFLAAERFHRNGLAKYCSIKCQRDSLKNRIKTECYRCGKSIERIPSKARLSKSGLFFCSRECKDIAQSLEGGCKEIQPEHYGNANGKNTYRVKALKRYPNKCANIECNWYEDTRILEVHHIDSNRKNNSLDNLIILCPICHRKITLGYYELKNRHKLIPRG